MFSPSCSRARMQHREDHREQQARQGNLLAAARKPHWLHVDLLQCLRRLGLQMHRVRPQPWAHQGAMLTLPSRTHLLVQPHLEPTCHLEQQRQWDTIHRKRYHLEQQHQWDTIHKTHYHHAQQHPWESIQAHQCARAPQGKRHHEPHQIHLQHHERLLQTPGLLRRWHRRGARKMRTGTRHRRK